MRFWASGLLTGCSLLCAGAAAAAPISYDCDTAAGSFSVIEQVQAGPTYHLRGTITPRTWRSDRRWAPSVRIGFGTADDSRRAWITLTRQPDRPGADAGMEVADGGEPGTIALGNVGLNQPIAFDLALSASGDGAVTLGTEHRSFHFNPGPNAKMSVTCSTGEFLFSDLDWAS